MSIFRTPLNRLVDKAKFAAKVDYQNKARKRSVEVPKEIELPAWFICKYDLKPVVNLNAWHYLDIDVLVAEGWDGNFKYFTNIDLNANVKQEVFQDDWHRDMDWHYLLTNILAPIYSHSEALYCRWKKTQYARDHYVTNKMKLRQDRKEEYIRRRDRYEAWAACFVALDKKQLVEETISIMKAYRAAPWRRMAKDRHEFLMKWLKEQE